MHQNNHIGRAVDELCRIFDILNEHYYENSLPELIITIQKAKKAGNLGWFTLKQVWVNKETGEYKYELNACPEGFNQDIYTIVDTIQHELVHYQNKLTEIKDCNGNVHNKKFKELAEKKRFDCNSKQKIWMGTYSTF